MVTEKQVYDAVYASLKVVTGKPLEGLNPGTKLIEDLQLESIDTVDLLFQIEKSLKLSINLADVFQTRRAAQGQRRQFDLSVREIAGYILEMLNK